MAVATRIIVFVAISTLTTSLALAWASAQAEHTAVETQLESQHARTLRGHEKRLRRWLADRGKGLEEALSAPAGQRVLDAGLAVLAADTGVRLEIVGPDGAGVAGALDPAPHRDALAASLVALATPGSLPGPETVVYVAARSLGRTPYYLVSSTPRAPLFAASSRRSSHLVATSLAVSALFTLLAHRITRRTLEPLHRLSHGAERISHGELALDIDLASVRAQRDEIGLLTRTFDSMLNRLRANQREIEHSNARLLERNLELQHANQVLEQLSITDGLTKLHNHRYFQELLAQESKRIERTGAAMALMLIDLDDFKRLNDCYGHAAGDQVLSAIASRLNESIRETDLIARYGGEEFVVLSCGTNLMGARVLAEKIRLAIEQTTIQVDDCQSPLLVTVSIGVAEYSGCCKRLFREADAALYRAKALGKNCVIQAEV
jgi:diguanylate cyclase (GGDEF)-like protein